MKRNLLIIGALAMVAGCVGGMGRGCGGCISSFVQKEIEKQTGVELGGGMSQEEIENYRLTDADVEKYIKDFPKLAKDFEDLSEIIERTPGKPLKGLTAMTGSKKMMAELRAMGWNPPQRFFAVHYAIWMGIGYNNIKSAMEEYRKQMEEMLNNPDIPPEQKRQIRESLKEMERLQEEMQEEMRDLEKNNQIKHNARVVERHMDELNRMLEKLD